MTLDMSTEYNGEYIIDDARELASHESDANIAVVDLAWARPMRNGVFVNYPTHAPGNGLWDFVDAVYDSLLDGGWAIFDSDSWLLPRLISYLQTEWGDVASTYSGGGYRRTGWVKQPSGAGHYFTNGGYPVVFAHKGATDRKTSEPASCEATVSTEVKQTVDWGTLKPVKPYQKWLEAVINDGETVVIPCAGSAPAAVACERSNKLNVDWLAVDSEPGAKKAFEKRLRLQTDNGQQTLPTND